MPASIVYEILKLFIIQKQNAKEIEIALKSKSNKVPNYSTILKILHKLGNV